MFMIGEKVVHPMHGAGVIDGIVRENISGTYQEYYVFKMSAMGLVLKVPTANAERIGLRALDEASCVEEVLQKLPALPAEMSGNWNQRYRENLERLKSGRLLEVAVVIKGLMLRGRGRSLSTGERKMLSAAKQILISEISLTQNVDYHVAEQEIDEAVVPQD